MPRKTIAIIARALTRAQNKKMMLQSPVAYPSDCHIHFRRVEMADFGLGQQIGESSAPLHQSSLANHSDPTKVIPMSCVDLQIFKQSRRPIVAFEPCEIENQAGL